MYYNKLMNCTHYYSDWLAGTKLQPKCQNNAVWVIYDNHVKIHVCNTCFETMKQVKPWNSWNQRVLNFIEESVL